MDTQYTIQASAKKTSAVKSSAMKTGLEHLVPKKISGPVKESDRGKLTITQNMALDHASQRLDDKESRLFKILERVIQYQQQLKAAVRRGDMVMAKRLYRMAKNAADNAQALMSSVNMTYNTAPTDAVASSIQRMKNVVKSIERETTQMAQMIGKTRGQKAPNTLAADNHEGRKANVTV